MWFPTAIAFARRRGGAGICMLLLMEWVLGEVEGGSVLSVEL